MRLSILMLLFTGALSLTACEIELDKDDDDEEEDDEDGDGDGLGDGDGEGEGEGSGGEDCSICEVCVEDADCLGSEWCVPYDDTSSVCTIECEVVNDEWSCPGSSECWELDLGEDGVYYLCFGDGEDPCDAGFSC